MNEMLKPITSESLKDVFVARFEELILSGKISIGQKLPSERELAIQLNVSRPVVHEGLVDLASKGLVTMMPRVGTAVNDYRKEGSLAMLTTLVNYHKGNLNSKLLQSMMEMRILFEVETARLAALNRSEIHLREFHNILAHESQMDLADSESTAELDFAFHHLLAMASNNFIYPLLINSFKQVYTNLSGQALTAETLPEIYAFHHKLVQAIEARDEEQAMDVMRRMLVHGEENFRALTRK